MNTIFSRGIHFLYERCIRPYATNEDARRQELILNILIVSTITMVLMLSGAAIRSMIAKGAQYRGISPVALLTILGLFSSILLLSRRGYIQMASYALIGIYFLCNTYTILKWGFLLPATIAGSIIVILIASILISTRFGFVMTGIVATSTTTITYLHITERVPVLLYWRYEPIHFKDPLVQSILFLVVMTVSWLSNREIASSLARARTSEAALLKERDLLEIKVEERTRELKNIQAEKLSNLYRFAEFGRLSSGLFHDLMTPLTAIIGTVEKLRSSPERLPELEIYLQKAVTNSKRMGILIAAARKQIDITTIEQLFSLNKELQEAIDILHYRAREASATIIVRMKKDLVTYGNPLKFHQVALNLISNAVDAVEAVSSEHRSVVVELEHKGNRAVLSVHDNGIGIAAELHQKIFDPFFTTKSAKGMGLGLSTTKDIVKRYFKGDMYIKSIEGKGSTFIVRIPLTLHATTTSPDIPINHS